MSTPTRITHLIGHRDYDGTADRTSEVYNPATGEVTGTLDLASAQVVDQVGDCRAGGGEGLGQVADQIRIATGAGFQALAPGEAHYVVDFDGPALRKLRDDNDANGFSRDLWKQFAEMGFTGVLIPETEGGLGLGHLGNGSAHSPVG